MSKDREIIKSRTYAQGQTGDMRDLEKVLENEYLKQRRPSKFTTKTSFSPSTVGYGKGNCPRYWVLAFRGGDWLETTDAMGIANMANGSAAHERIENLFESAGILVSKEVEIRMKNPPIRGYIDVLIRWEDEVVVGEIKTTRPETFMFRRAEMKPAYYHLLQLLIYMEATGKKKGFLLYENKGDQGLLVIEVTMSEENKEVLDYALDWMRDVSAAHENNQLPKAVYQQRNKFCQECPLKKQCWEDPNFDVILPKLEVKKFIDDQEVRQSEV